MQEQVFFKRKMLRKLRKAVTQIFYSKDVLIMCLLYFTLIKVKFFVKIKIP